jgi:hypothetical protein
MLEEPCTLVIALAETPPSRQQARAAASAARGPSVVRRFHCGCETPRIVSDSFLRNKILSLARVGELGRDALPPYFGNEPSDACALRGLPPFARFTSCNRLPAGACRWAPRLVAGSQKQRACESVGEKAFLELAAVVLKQRDRGVFWRWSGVSPRRRRRSQPPAQALRRWRPT